MGWIRCRKQHGVLLALAALLLQIALAFGHVHGYVPSRPVHLHAVAGALAAPRIAGSHETALAQATQQAPLQKPGDDEDYCAICASIFLASISLSSAPPQLTLPSFFGPAEHLLDHCRGLAEPRRAAFRSRAPPLA